MSLLEAFFLGIVQGLTEFLPVSSSGHIELGKVLLGIQDVGIDFTILVHIATACASVLVFRKDIYLLLKGMLAFEYDQHWQFALKLLLSAIPVALVGLLFKDQLEALFAGNMLLVGSMLLVTATLLFLTTLVKRGEQDIGWHHALLIGLAQTVAILPGISRSGATIATALLLKVDRTKAAKFSFLMVLIPIFGQALLDLVDVVQDPSLWELPLNITLVAFVASFLSGLLACAWMLKIVQGGKLYYFGIYCVVVGLVAIFA